MPMAHSSLLWLLLRVINGDVVSNLTIEWLTNSIWELVSGCCSFWPLVPFNPEKIYPTLPLWIKNYTKIYTRIYKLLSDMSMWVCRHVCYTDKFWKMNIPSLVNHILYKSLPTPTSLKINKLNKYLRKTQHYPWVSKCYRESYV